MGTIPGTRSANTGGCHACRSGNADQTLGTGGGSPSPDQASVHPRGGQIRDQKPKGTEMYKAPKAILNHPGVEECISGDAGGFDYKHDIFLKPEWEFTRGRNAGCRSLRAHTVKEFFEAKPKTNTGGRK